VVTKEFKISSDFTCPELNEKVAVAKIRITIYIQLWHQREINAVADNIKSKIVLNMKLLKENNAEIEVGFIHSYIT